MDNKVGTVALWGSEEYPASTLEINYYIQKLCESYAKLFIIEELCKIQLQKPKVGFLIEANSPPTNPLKMTSYRQTVQGKNVIGYEPSFNTRAISSTFSNFPLDRAGRSINKTHKTKLDFTQNKLRQHNTDLNSVVRQNKIGASIVPFDFNNQNHAEFFFASFRKVQRPVVYYIEESTLIPLYDYFGEDSLKLTSLNISSPLEAAISGIVGLLDTLLSHESQRDIRQLEEMLKKQEYLTNNLALSEKIVNIWGQLNNPEMPLAYKQYLLQQLRFTIETQAKLNSQMGITYGLNARA